MSALNGPQVLKVPGLTAAADLTSHQYKFVEIVGGTTTVNVVNAVTDRPIGVLLNKPKAGEACEVIAIGVTEVVAGETLAAGDMLSVGATGKATNDAAQAGTTYQGRILSAGAADELVTCIINCVV